MSLRRRRAEERDREVQRQVSGRRKREEEEEVQGPGVNGVCCATSVESVLGESVRARGRGTGVAGGSTVAPSRERPSAARERV